MTNKNLEYCSKALPDDPGHCQHWYDCEPCCKCNDDTRDINCDCSKCFEYSFKQLLNYIHQIDNYFNEYGWESYALLHDRREIADIIEKYDRIYR